MRNLFVLICCAVILVACSKKENATSATTNVSIPSAKNIPVEAVEVYAAVDQLRVRDLPSLQSRVIVELQEGDTLYYLNAATVRREQLNLRGKVYNAPWIKVRTKDNKQGWTYGGAVVNQK